MLFFRFTLWLLVLLGHVALWVALFNRLHAWAIPRWGLKSIEKVLLAMAAVGTAAWVWLSVRGGGLPATASLLSVHPLLIIYSAICLGLALLTVSSWVGRHLLSRPPIQLLSNDTQRHRVDESLGESLAGSWLARLMDVVPQHQMYELWVHEKRLALGHLPAALDELVIAHISDLHLTGHIRRAYFEYLVDRVNETDADIVAITGDLIDGSACLSWLSPLLGQLRARHGVYFVLGNHDERYGFAPEIRNNLTEAGLVDLGGSCHNIEIRGVSVLLAGNERPWFGPAPDVVGRHAAEVEFRVLLSHSPDQLPWARRRGFDLMLAGHTHGGQIRLPVLGPIVSPSTYGVKYASGLFDAPPTLMHVTRGVSGKEPIRWNCPPELAKLVLVRPEGTSPHTPLPVASACHTDQ